MAVTVVSCGGKRCRVPFKPNMTCNALAEAFYAHACAELVTDMTLLHKTQCIFRGERVLACRDATDTYSGRILADYGIEPEAVIHSVLGLNSGPILFGRKITDCVVSASLSGVRLKRISKELQTITLPGIVVVGMLPTVEQFQEYLETLFPASLAVVVLSFLPLPTHVVLELIFQPSNVSSPSSLSSSSASLSSMSEGRCPVWHKENPYRGGKFRLLLGFPLDYPYTRPDCLFVTPISNPLVSETGVFSIPGYANGVPWSPSSTVDRILKLIVEEVFDPLLAMEAANDFNNRTVDKATTITAARVMATAREWTLKFAE